MRFAKLWWVLTTHDASYPALSFDWSLFRMSLWVQSLASQTSNQCFQKPYWWRTILDSKLGIQRMGKQSFSVFTSSTCLPQAQERSSRYLMTSECLLTTEEALAQTTQRLRTNCSSSQKRNKAFKYFSLQKIGVPELRICTWWERGKKMRCLRWMRPWPGFQVLECLWRVKEQWTQVTEYKMHCQSLLC